MNANTARLRLALRELLAYADASCQTGLAIDELTGGEAAIKAAEQALREIEA